MLPISFLSDYGHRDEWVGVCRGVIERIDRAAHRWRGSISSFGATAATAAEKTS